MWETRTASPAVGTVNVCDVTTVYIRLGFGLDLTDKPTAEAVDS